MRFRASFGQPGTMQLTRALYADQRVMSRPRSGPKAQPERGRRPELVAGVAAARNRHPPAPRAGRARRRSCRAAAHVRERRSFVQRIGGRPRRESSTGVPQSRWRERASRSRGSSGSSRSTALDGRGPGGGPAGTSAGPSSGGGDGAAPSPSSRLTRDHSVRRDERREGRSMPETIEEGSHAEAGATGLTRETARAAGRFSLVPAVATRRNGCRAPRRRRRASRSAAPWAGGSRTSPTCPWPAAGWRCRASRWPG